MTPIVVPFWHEGKRYVNLNKCTFTDLGDDGCVVVALDYKVKQGEHGAF